MKASVIFSGVILAASTEAYVIPGKNIQRGIYNNDEASLKKRDVGNSDLKNQYLISPTVETKIQKGARYGMYGLAGYGAFEVGKNLLHRVGIFKSSSTSSSGTPTTSFNTDPVTTTIVPTSAIASATIANVPAAASPAVAPPSPAANANTISMAQAPATALPKAA